MTKIYLVTSHRVNEMGILGEAFYTKVFTNKKKALAYLNFVNLSDKISKDNIKVNNQLKEFEICHLDWTKDVERLEESIKELPY